MLTRIGHCTLAMLRALDLLACTAWLCLLYPFGLADRPTGREMVSSYVGRGAFHGRRWAIRAAAVIDWLFLHLGEAPDHCLRAYLFYSRLDEPMKGE